jgi:hypothetical protein
VHDDRQLGGANDAVERARELAEIQMKRSR